jgi:hypothetical protein
MVVFFIYSNTNAQAGRTKHTSMQCTLTLIAIRTKV